MRKVKLALIGAGVRGADAYGAYALRKPHEVEFVAVADPGQERRDRFAEAHGIPVNRRYTSWDDLLAGPQLADGVVIATQDSMHVDPALAAMEKGYHILLEKPMATDPGQVLELTERARESGVILTVCFVLRYTPFFTRLRDLLTQGRIGQLMSVQLHENVGYWHMAHSFVRGNWRNSRESTPMIVAKSCHDMDILLWLVGEKCQKVSSFGSLLHFRPENAPEGAAQRCLECPVEPGCPYSAVRLYLGENTDWPTSVVSLDPSLQARTEALRTGPYGRCVYHCDNDAVDHQVVNLQFESGITAGFHLSAFTDEVSRTIKVMGSHGEIRGHMGKNELLVVDFSLGDTETLRLGQTTSGHGGGDEGLMRSFVEQIKKGCNLPNEPEQAAWGHLVAFAAEKARLSCEVISLSEFVASLRS